MMSKEIRELEMGDQISVAGVLTTIVSVKDISMGWHRIEVRNSVPMVGMLDFRSDAVVAVIR